MPCVASYRSGGASELDRAAEAALVEPGHHFLPKCFFSCSTTSVGALGKSSISKNCRTSTSGSRPAFGSWANGILFAHSMASAFDLTLMIQYPAISSLVSANGPSVTTTLPFLRPTRAPFDVGWSPAPSTITPASISCWLYLPIVASSCSVGMTPASVFLSALTIIMNRTSFSLHRLVERGRPESTRRRSIFLLAELRQGEQPAGCRNFGPPFDKPAEGDITMRTDTGLWILQGLLA